jgi:2-C-methyl-D-erythritol 2,4-cyclodiphosphate synthase
MFRIGIGTDTHRLEPGRQLILGGVVVETAFGAVGHSDADALAHAITDAILGAMGEGDIGLHFPDRDPQWKNANSLQLLARVMWLAGERGMRVVNIDSTISLETPKLRPFVYAMKENLAAVVGVESELISIKAKTAEGLDAVGEGKAVSVQAVVLMERA